jgi:uncharacterized protein (DUF2141 family)
MTALLLLVVTAAAGLQARPPRDVPTVRPAGTAMLAGVVSTTGESPQPIRRALVTLSGGGLPATVQTVTDDSGRFVFTELPAGRYTLTVDKPAWVRTYFGSKRVGRGPATPIALADGQRLTNIRIGLLRGGAIEGTVVDEHGKPLASAQVQVSLVTILNGERKLVPAQGAQPWATTDDRGRYRLFGLPPGDYVVRSSGSGLSGGGVRLTTEADVDAAMKGGTPSGGPAIGRRHAYFPGVLDAASAEVITLTADAERTGIDIVVPLVRTSRIDGIAITGGGQPLRNVMVGIANLSSGSLWSSPGIVRPGMDGRFSMPSMAPGRYLFFGRGTDSDASPDGGAVLPLWTATEVLVEEGETVDAVLRFLPGVTVSGRVSLDGASVPADVTKFRLAIGALSAIAGATVGLPAVSLKPDGSFAFGGVAPGKYRLALQPLGAWTLRSAIVEGRETLDLPLEVQPGRDVVDMIVTLTDRPSEISGTLFDQLDRPAPEYAIVAFSTERAYWTTAPRRISGVVKVGSDGTFVVRGLPPGEYFLTALIDLDSSQLADPKFLEYLATASIRITVGEGEKKLQDLKLPS